MAGGSNEHNKQLYAARLQLLHRGIEITIMSHQVWAYDGPWIPWATKAPERFQKSYALPLDYLVSAVL